MEREVIIIDTSNISFNTIGMIATIVAILIFIFMAIRRTRKEASEYFNTVEMTFPKLLDTVKDELSELIKDDTFIGTSEFELSAARKRKANISNALSQAVYGIDSAKEVVMDLIYNVVVKYLPTIDDVLTVVDFKSEYLDTHIMFEILMYKYKQTYGKAAFKEFVKKYDLDRERYIIEDKTKPSYVITDEDMINAYKAENLELSYVDMVKVLSILLFQKYKGFGVIDTVRAMDINGVNIGTSGSVLTYLRKQTFVAPNSVWVNFDGKYIHLRFLTMGSEEETRRIVTLIAKYNNPGPLTEKRGFIVTHMYDKSRVLAVRPPLSEYWAVFIRKFEVNPMRLIQLVKKDYMTNWEIVYEWLKYLMYGQVTTIVSGRQGSGKTTLMASMIEYIDPRYTIRVIEMTFELFLREMYPERNILTLQETEFIDASKAQDALKKSDGAVSLFGEIATDEIAMRAIQTMQVASIYTLASHHANTSEDLIYSLRNSIANVGAINNIKTAEQQVLDVIHMNVHPDYNADGKRYIAYIDEIVKLDESKTYPELNKKDLDYSKATIEREYYTRSTDRKSFAVKRLMHYDVKTDTYIADNPPSMDLINYMIQYMPEKYVMDFKLFIKNTWFGKE